MKQEKLPKDERVLWAIVHSLGALIIFLFLLFGFIIKPAGAGSAIDVEFLWDALHPASFINIVGVIISLVAMLTLAGLPRFLFGEILIPPGSSWPNLAAWAAGVLGAVLMFA